MHCQLQVIFALYLIVWSQFLDYISEIRMYANVCFFFWSPIFLTVSSHDSYYTTPNRMKERSFYSSFNFLSFMFMFVCICVCGEHVYMFTFM